MNIPKAIEILTLHTNGADKFDLPDLPEAIKLGKEALELLEKRRRFAVPDKADLLPGETKD